MGGSVMDLLDRAEDHRRGALDRPAHQVPWAVAVLYLGEPLFDRHEFAVRAGGHVTASQNAGQRVWRGIELQAQDVGKSAFAGFDLSGQRCRTVRMRHPGQQGSRSPDIRIRAGSFSPLRAVGLARARPSGPATSR
jgi:hypothetical protein